MEQKIYYQDLSEEHATCDEFFNLAEQYDHDAYNVAYEDVANVIDRLKGFVKTAPRYLEPYLWLEEIYRRNRRERSANAIFKKACAKAFQMVLGKEKRWPDELPWGGLENRTLIHIFIRKAEGLWHMGQNNQLLLDQALTIYLNLINSNPYDQPCARIFALAVLEGISNNDFHTQFMAYNEFGDHCIKNEAFIWFEDKGPKHESLLPWVKYAKSNHQLWPAFALIF